MKACRRQYMLQNRGHASGRPKTPKIGLTLEPARRFAAGLALLPWLLFPVATQAATIAVSDSIGRAIAAAKPGDTLLICGPAVFHEHVRLDKPLRLLGTNSPVIDGENSGSRASWAQ